MNAEEIGVEDRGEDSLLDADFGEDGEEFGGEVEVVVEEHEPATLLIGSASHTHHPLVSDS